MNKINWVQVVVLGVVLLLFFIIAGSLLPMSWSGRGPGWMMGPGMMGGWVGMLFMGLFPLGLLALLILAIVWLVRQVSSSQGPTPPVPPQAATERVCPHCNRPVQADWRVCPYCSQSLT